MPFHSSLFLLVAMIGALRTASGLAQISASDPLPDDSIVQLHNDGWILVGTFTHPRERDLRAPPYSY